MGAQLLTKATLVGTMPLVKSSTRYLNHLTRLLHYKVDRLSQFVAIYTYRVYLASAGLAILSGLKYLYSL